MTSAATMPVSSSGGGASTGVSPRLRIAYLTTEYPKVSHTFIRREILELERRGHSVLRLAIRNSGGVVADPVDVEEQVKTIHCLTLPKWQLLFSVMIAKWTHPIRFLKALCMTLRMSRVSDRGLMKHVAYLVEAAALLRILRRHRIQHVHVHFGTNAAAVARLMRCLGNVTYSMTVHGPNEFDSPRGFSLAEKTADAAFIVAISDFCSAQLRRWAAPEHWRKIHVIRCTVGEEFFECEVPISHRLNTLLCIGRLSAQKGQLLLIDAMKRLMDVGVDAQLVLAGDGEMRQVIEQRVAHLGLSSRVRITGWIDEQGVREQLLNARALVQPSFAEGLPVVMMEALAMARPVIATMIAGVPELVRDGENGWLITAGNLEQLTSAMRDALTAPVERLNEMGAAGRRIVRQRHLTTAEVDRLESLLLQFGGGV